MKIETVRAPNPGPFTLDGTNSYVIEEAVIIDPGPDLESHLAALVSAAPFLDAIFVTHRHADHAGAVAELKARTGALVFGPDVIGEIDHPLRDGESFTIGSSTMEAIATPGHTAEHFCFLTSTGDLFTGDMVLGEGTTAVFPPDGRMEDYLDSLRKLADRKPAALYPGHGPVRLDAVAWIEHYLEHRAMRDRQILEALKTPSTLAELRVRVYPDLGAGLQLAAEAQLTAHLIRLIEHGRVAASDRIYRAV
jgi:glyoxylase-like metal-dependent hydrolase (beta-lactamase superfamily II)